MILQSPRSDSVHIVKAVIHPNSDALESKANIAEQPCVKLNW